MRRGLAVAFMLLSIRFFANAQTEKQLDSVLVTAQKREELVQKIPFSITAISSKQVKEYRLWNSKEITAIVPNLYSADPGDDRNVTGIRGITTTSYNPAVATYIDGVNQFGLDTYISQLFDVERIEILRGPQGTLYGRNAMGGVINIITKQPSDITTGSIEATLGNYGQQRYTAALRTPLVKGKLFLGVAGIFDKRDGFYENAFNGSSYDDRQSFTGNYYLKYRPGNKWQLSLNAKHHNNRNKGPFPLVAADPFEMPFKLNQNALTKMIDNTQNYSLSADYKGTGLNFSSQTAFQNNYRYYTNPIDGDFSPLDAITVINNYGKDWNNIKTWTQEFKVSSPSSATTLKWLAGSYLFHNSSPVKQATRFGEDAAAVGAPDINFSSIITSRSKSSGLAVYGQVSRFLSDKLELVGGLRYDYERQKSTVLGEIAYDMQPSFVVRPDTSARTSFSAFSPKAAINYTIARNSILYGLYSRGFRTGGLTQLSSDPSQPPLYAYKPEYSNNFEAGLKSSLFNGGLNINLAAFYSIIDNTQVPSLVLPDAITIIRNSGKLTSRGVEMELAAIPFKGLSVNYSFGYTNAKFDDLKVSADGAEVDYSGKRQIFTPEITSMFALQYVHVLWKEQKMNLLVRGEWRYLGNTWFDAANTIKQSPYSVLNANIGISFRNYGLSIWGRNLGDKEYVAYAYDFGAQHLGNPLTYGVTLSARF
ncbi:MAG: TonB-dependent receptor [Chitinophagaceae bacterium]|nr:TonB-dependent receptor [Chitinophagaceae bacterium]